MSEESLFIGSGYRVGRFHCPPRSSRWDELNWIGTKAHVVVPSTAVAITVYGQEPYVATANEVLLYDKDVYYRRGLISERGDQCVFIEIDDVLASELGAAVGGRGRGLQHMPLPAASFATQCLLWTDRAAERVDEWVVDLIGVVAEHLDPFTISTRQRRAVEELKSMLASSSHRAVSLAEYASTVHYSPFALARMFRAHTGYSIGQFRRQLRLRASLDDVLRRDDLSAVAARHGFSSHSHYTSEFRRVFGFTPSQARTGQVLLR